MGQQYTKMESETNAVNAFRCIFCDGDLVWHSTVQASDFIADYEDDDIAAVNYYVCSKCGRSYEIVDPWSLNEIVITQNTGKNIRAIDGHQIIFGYGRSRNQTLA